MEETCAFCADEQSLAGGLHPQVPFTLVWPTASWRLFADLTAESSGFSLLAPRRHVATVPELEPGEAAGLGPTLARLMEALQFRPARRPSTCMRSTTRTCTFTSRPTRQAMRSANRS